MSVKPDAWMPLYFGAYLSDTMHLTTEQHGAYLLLLMAAWKRGGSLPDDDKQLSGITKLTPKGWRKTKPVVAQFWSISDGEWKQKRLSDELEKANQIIRQKSEAGKLSAAKRWGNRPSNGPIASVITDPVTLGIRQNAPLPVPIPTTKSKALSGRPDLKPQAEEIINFLNVKTGHAYKPVESNLKLVVSLLKQGFTSDDIRAVIVSKCRKWQGDPKMAEYLRPITLFRASNFANYEGQLAQVNNEQAA